MSTTNMDQNFIDLLKENIDEVKDDVRRIESKVDQLLEFKWQIIGGSLFASILITMALQFVAMIFK